MPTLEGKPGVSDPGWPGGKTGPHSFKDATGVEWVIEGYSRVCGPAYVDCRSLDGKALTIRPVAYLEPAGLSLPEGAEPPTRTATAGEKKNAEAQASQALGRPVKTPRVPAAKKRAPRKKTAPSLEEPGQEAEGTPQATGAGGADVIPFPTTDPVRAFKTGLRIGSLAIEPPPRARVVNMHREGWDVDISRNGPWGNPYSHLPDSAAQYVVETRERAIDLYREWMRQRVRDGEPGLVQALAALHGLRLGCYCAPEPCHGEVLVEAAEWAAQTLLTHSRPMA